MPEATQTKSASAFHPVLGVAGVLLGAALATFLGRLLSVGAADLRGALHLDFDAASWIGTTYNMGLMFIGPFSVYPRRSAWSASSIASVRRNLHRSLSRDALCDSPSPSC